MVFSNLNDDKTADRLYSVPLISQDLSHEETIIQIADTLQYLNDIINDVFNHVNVRIDANLKTTEGLINRISVCSKKVAKLTGANKAIQVFSSAKYPSSGAHKNYSALFVHNESMPVFTRSDHSTKHNMKRKPDKSFQEKREFFHVKVEQVEDYAVPAVIENKSLGKIAKDINMIGSLLVFNTDESLYDIYNKSNANKGRLNQNQSGTMREYIGAGILEAAPSSITNRERLIGKDADNYLYAPDLGQVPEFDVPLDLPHLPGIAGDLQYVVDAELTIAPSAVTPSSFSANPDVLIEDLLDEITDLPEVESEITDNLITCNIAESSPALHPPPPPPPPLPPPPLPPLQPILEVNIPVTNNTSAERSETDFNIKSNKDGPNPEPTKVMLPSVDAHSSLMDAIRKAGGARGSQLRSASLVETSKASQSTGGGDLMADLHAKLSMRRKGISGDKPQDSGTILDKLSSLIPPPPPNTSNAEISSNEEEWD